MSKTQLSSSALPYSAPTIRLGVRSAFNTKDNPKFSVSTVQFAEEAPYSGTETEARKIREIREKRTKASPERN